MKAEYEKKISNCVIGNDSNGSIRLYDVRGDS